EIPCGTCAGCCVQPSEGGRARVVAALGRRREVSTAVQRAHPRTTNRGVPRRTVHRSVRSHGAARGVPVIETFVEALARHEREQPLKLALVDDRVRLTWREVAGWVESAASGLAAQAGSRRAAVLGWLPNAAEWYLLRWACERAGLLWVPVSANQGVREITLIISRVRPALLVTCAHFRQRDYVREAEGACREAGLDVPP